MALNYAALTLDRERVALEQAIERDSKELARIAERKLEISSVLEGNSLSLEHIKQAIETLKLADPERYGKPPAPELKEPDQ
jgi:hypothetical protein